MIFGGWDPGPLPFGLVFGTAGLGMLVFGILRLRAENRELGLRGRERARRRAIEVRVDAWMPMGRDNDRNPRRYITSGAIALIFGSGLLWAAANGWTFD